MFQVQGLHDTENVRFIVLRKVGSHLPIDRAQHPSVYETVRKQLFLSNQKLS
jgi:hypothetical protein